MNKHSKQDILLKHHRTSPFTMTMSGLLAENGIKYLFHLANLKGCTTKKQNTFGGSNVFSFSGSPKHDKFGLWPRSNWVCDVNSVKLAYNWVVPMKEQTGWHFFGAVRSHSDEHSPPPSTNPRYLILLSIQNWRQNTPGDNNHEILVNTNRQQGSWFHGFFS